MVDKSNYNYFTPLLYQVATGFLDASSISYPFRKLFRNKGISFRVAEVLRDIRSFGLTLVFAMSMLIFLNYRAPFNYSVFPVSFSSLLLASSHGYQ